MNPQLSQTNNTANKRPLFITLLLLYILLGAISAYLTFNYSSLLNKIKLLNADRDKLASKNTDFNSVYSKLEKEHNELKTDYGKLKEAYEAVSADRANLLAQAKAIMTEKNRVGELADAIAKARDEIELVKNERQKTLDENLRFKEMIKRLEGVRVQLITENEQLSDILNKERDKSVAHQLAQENIKLQKENKELGDKIKQLEIEVIRIKDSTSKFTDNTNRETFRLKEEAAKAGREAKLLRGQVNKLNQDYAEAVKKNSKLEEQLMTLPKKFAEIGRQNKTLIKQTANMHYNLGVFYVEHKEYARAIIEFEKTLELTPDDAYAHFNAGYIYAEYLVDRPKAIEHFRHYLRLAKRDDKDVDWARRYILTWQTISGREPME